MRVILGSFAGLLLLGTIGCTPQSVEPFYTDKYVVVAPRGVLGNWRLTRDDLIDPTGSKAEGSAKAKPWVWTEKSVLTYDSQNVPSSLRTVFFKMGTNLYCDVTIASPSNAAKLNEYWEAHIIPVHTLFKVDIGKKLRLLPLSLGYVRKVAKKRDGASLTESPDDSGLYGTSSKAWVSFLVAHGERKSTFSQDDVVVLEPVGKAL